MKTNNKKVHDAFLDQIKTDFTSRDVHPVTNQYGEEEYTVKTIVGVYTFHAQRAFGTGRVKLRFLSVMGRFAEPAKARTQVDCNPHNGKWNFDGQGSRKTELEARGLASCIAQRILNLQEQQTKNDMKRPNITPGPWEVADDYTARLYNDQREETVWGVNGREHGNSPAYATSEEHAYAIAALPELLAALEKIKSTLAGHPEAGTGNTKVHYAMHAAKTALIKAGYTF